MKEKKFTKYGQLPLTKFLALICASLLFVGCGTTPQDNSGMDSDVSAPEKPHSEMMVLREGDVLRINFPASANFDTTQQIRRDGKITMPLVGEVEAAGKTPDQLQQDLIKLYDPQIATKEINVYVQSSTFPVFVTGAVVHPGKILSDHPMTALEAIMEAGGFNYDSANLGKVKVIRNENGKMQHFELDLGRELKGKETTPFYLKPSDIIFVPERFQIF